MAPPAAQDPRRRGGRPRKLDDEALEALSRIVDEHPRATLRTLLDRLEADTGVRVSTRTLRTRLQELGIVRVVPPKGRSVRRVDEPAPTVSQPGGSRHAYTDEHRGKAPGALYPMGLSDAEWELVADIFEAKVRGTPRKHDRRVMVDAMLYVVRGGVPWRMLPSDFPPWQLVYKTFRRWSKQGRFRTMMRRLRRMWRERQGRAAEPTAAIIDSQSVATSTQGGPKGFDAAKKVKGRKRHLLTDTLGLLLAVAVSAASVQDRDAAAALVADGRSEAPTVELLYADAAYAGQCSRHIEASQAGLRVEIVRRSDHRKTGLLVQPGQELLFDDLKPGTFQVLPKRWVVERSNAWTTRARRLARDQERTVQSAEAWVWLTHARMLLRRLTSQHGAVV
jgi:putative transposase